MSASASGNISIQCHPLLFKSVALAIQKIGQYVGIGIGIGLGNINVQGFRLLFKSVALAIQKVGQYVGIGLGKYQCTRFPLFI